MRRIEHDGRSLTIAEWSAATGVPKVVIRDRLRMGWGGAEAVSTPVDQTKRSRAEANCKPAGPKHLMPDGRTLTVKEIAAERGVEPNTVRSGMRRRGRAYLAGPPRAPLYERGGEWKTAAQWAAVFGISPQTVTARIARGEALDAPPGPIGRRPRLLEHGGESLTFREWAARTGLSEAALKSRIHAGWPVARALEAPLNARLRPTPERPARTGTPRGRTLEHDGLILTVREWSERTGLSVSAIMNRPYHGWPVGEALATPGLGKGGKRP